MVKGHGLQIVCLEAGLADVRQLADLAVLSQTEAVEVGVARGGVDDIERTVVTDGQHLRHFAVAGRGHHVARDRADLGQLAGKHVDGDELAVLRLAVLVIESRHGVQLAVGLVISHVDQNGVQVTHGRRLELAVLHNVQVAIRRAGHGVAVDILRRSELDIGLCCSLRGLGRIRLKARPGVVRRVEGEEAIELQCGLFVAVVAAEAKLELIGSCVARIVHDRNNDLVLLHGSDVDRKAQCLVCRLLVRRERSDKLAVRREELDGRDVLVILRRDVDELAARRIAGEEHLGDGRCLVIDGNERLPRCTLAEAGIIAVLVGGVVLRYGSQDELELRVVRERIALVVGEAPADALRRRGVGPGAVIRVVEGAGLFAVVLAEINLAGLCIADDVADVLRIADQVVVYGHERIARADSRAVSNKRIIVGVEVHAEDEGVAAARLLHIVVVLPRDIQVLVRHLVEAILGIDAGIEHGGIRPVAPEGQERDGLADAKLALGIGLGIQVDITLEVVAIGEVLLHILLAFLVQAQGCLDLHTAVGRDGHDVVALQALKRLALIGAALENVVKDLRIDLVGSAVAVQVGQRSVCKQLQSGGMVQDRHDVAVVELAVSVEVVARRIGREDRICADCNIVHGDELRAGLFIRDGFRRKHTGAEPVGDGLVRQVVDMEREAVGTGAGGIVAELHLDLAVVIAVNGHIGGAVHGVLHVAKAGALSSRGILHVGIRIHDGNGRAHHQALRQSADRQAGLFRKAVLPDVLRDNGCLTGSRRRRHGRAAHQAVGAVRARGIDVAAGGGDLGLQRQIAGYAPGAEGAHGDNAAGGVHVGVDAAAVDGQLAAPDAVLVLRGRGEDRLHLVKADCDERELLRAGRLRGIRIDLLIGEGNAVAAGDKDDLTGRVRKVGLLAAVLHGVVRVGRIADEHEVIFRAALVLGLIERRKGCALAGRAAGERLACAVGVGVVRAVDREILRGVGDVVGTGDGQRILIGAGGADAAGVGILGKQQAVDGVLSPVAGVTGRHANDGIRLVQRIHDIGEVGLAGGREADRRGAKGQVDAVAVQNDGILDGGDVVIGIGAAVLAEHLHNNDLRIGRNADDAVVSVGVGAVRIFHIAVGRGDTGNVRAVVALLIVVMRDVESGVNIVEAEGDLAADIQSIAGQALIALCGMQLRQDLVDLRGGQQIVIRDLLAVLRRGNQQAVIERSAVERRMV